MPYEVCIIQKGYYIVTEGSDLSARCTCTLIKGKKNVIVNTMTGWDASVLAEGLVRYDMEPKRISYVVCTNGSLCYTGTNYMFKDSIHIVGHSIQNKNTFLPEPFSEGKPFNIDGEDLQVIPTPGHTLNDVSVLVKTAKGIVAITGDLFIRGEDVENEYYWLTSRSECPFLQRNNRQVVLSKAKFIIPGYGLMFEVTPEMKKSVHKHREPFQPDKELMSQLGIFGTPSPPDQTETQKMDFSC
ncbi:metallo-beta-lactamase domain-containing protein 1 [Halyomorpha halys]|uniref:metallo-beta-lactamase domain-containing protein 1 n=1 Tax=Halyomorpha halys TaxID=286706 RepID=UPI0006D51818|nr:metallo-beta-lactamase domain-containing protein 1 isoform X1 [Halyomorpha halys]XP_024215085.1 metallo-beta-lactamase domain-containing protein 1 isoform X1 [Halyomorpha halys]